MKEIFGILCNGIKCRGFNVVAMIKKVQSAW